MVLTAMESPQAIMVYMTAAHAEEARTIASALVAQGLAACANIFPVVESLFWWDSAVQQAAESVFVVKSTQDRFDELCRVVRALHSYTTPCIVALPIAGGDPDFLHWLHQSTRPGCHSLNHDSPKVADNTLV